ncbi:unnamed protein product, partial [Cladocopium goreaui]
SSSFSATLLLGHGFMGNGKSLLRSMCLLCLEERLSKRRSVQLLPRPSFHEAYDDETKARPKKDRRQRIERRIFELMATTDSMEKLIEGLQEEARRHPYERFVIKGVLDRCRPVQTVSGGVALRL